VPNSTQADRRDDRPTFVDKRRHQPGRQWNRGDTPPISPSNNEFDEFDEFEG
jgi:hypothetical protein